LVSKRGRNFHVPALNVVQSVLVRRKVGDLRACRVHVPCQVLPKANWGTIMQRWSQWSVFCSSGPGRKLRKVSVGLPFGLGQEAPLNVALADASWKVSLLTMDNLIANFCIVAKEQRGFEQDRDAVLLDVACQHHSAALCGKPVIMKLGSGSLASAYVRFAHILESSRSFTSFLGALDAEVEASLTLRLVLELPEESVAAKALSRQWLEFSMVAMDLSQGDIDSIVEFDNGPWGEDAIVHYCIPGCVCRGKPRLAMQRAKNVVRLSLGGGFPVPLLYRFKHMEQTSSKILRGRLQHRLLPRALTRMFPQKARQKARADVVAAAGEELAFAVKQNVRGDQVVTFFEDKDPSCILSKQAHLIPAPIQRFMNACFEAEAAVTEASIGLTLGWDDEASRKACSQAMRLNSVIISGERGWQVVAGYTEALLDFKASAWRALPVNDEEQFNSALLMLCAMASAWRRLCVPFDQPRFKIFAACHMQGQSVFDVAHISRVVDPILALQAGCPQCVDSEFTSKILPALASRQGHRMRGVVDLLASILMVLRMSSVSVERAHLPAEESKPARARGRAMEISTLSSHTYRRFARDEHHVVHDKVREKVLQEHGLSRMQFSSLLRGGRLGSSGGKMGMGNRQPRAFTGIDVFRSQDWNKEVAIVGGRLGKPEHLAEMTRINAAWAALTDGERQCFRGRAQGETTVREQARQLATFSAVDELGLRPKARAAMMRDVATQAMKKIAEHPTWSAGLGIWHHAAAVAPSLVVGDAQADIEALRR
jgi:hypothetical protein